MICENAYNYLRGNAMRRILPNEIYKEKPCSVVAVGCALGASEDALQALTSSELRSDGYLSLDGMNRLIRAHMGVRRRVNFKRGQRPTLKEFMDDFETRAVVCVKGHYVYVNFDDYYSFFNNDNDEVVTAWLIK